MGPNLRAFAETCKERGHHHRAEREIVGCLLAEYSRIVDAKPEPVQPEAT